MLPRLRAAACHVAPVILNARATTDKCISLIHRAARAKANLVVFPETYIPAFPIWSAICAPTENHELFRRIVEESIYADGPQMQSIMKAARDTGTVVSIGFSEKVRYSTATLFNSNLIIGPEGGVLVHHRKLVPTFFEKLVWTPGDGYGLRVAETKFGKIGALICGENTNPLARYAMMAMGEQVHIAPWPAIWPTRKIGNVEYKDPKDSKGRQTSTVKINNYDNVAANRIRTAAHCFEAKCYGISCAAYLSKQNVADLLRLFPERDDYSNTLQLSSRAPSMFMDPTGAPHPSFTVDEFTGKETAKDFLRDGEDILYADIDLNNCVEGKQYHDVVGGYQRLDVFDYRVDRRRREPATFAE